MRHRALAALVVLVSPLVLIAPASADDGQPEARDLKVGWRGAMRYGDFEAPLDEVDRLILAGRDPRADKKLQAFLRGVLEHSWHDPALGTALARAAATRAVLRARAGDRTSARWWWQVGLELDPGVVQSDLERFGNVRWLREVSLRVIGDRPSGYEDIRPPLRKSERQAESNALSGGVVLHNEGARQEGIKPVTVELLVDEKGAVSEPRIVTERVHPLVAFAVLQALERLDVRPAERDGRAVPSVFRLDLGFRASRW